MMFSKTTWLVLLDRVLFANLPMSSSCFLPDVSFQLFRFPSDVFFINYYSFPRNFSQILMFSLPLSVWSYPNALASTFTDLKLGTIASCSHFLLFSRSAFCIESITLSILQLFYLTRSSERLLVWSHSIPSHSHPSFLPRHHPLLSHFRHFFRSNLQSPRVCSCRKWHFCSISDMFHSFLTCFVEQGDRISCRLSLLPSFAKFCFFLSFSTCPSDPVIRLVESHSIRPIQTALILWIIAFFPVFRCFLPSYFRGILAVSRKEIGLEVAKFWRKKEEVCLFCEDEE